MWATFKKLIKKVASKDRYFFTICNLSFVSVYSDHGIRRVAE